MLLIDSSLYSSLFDTSLALGRSILTTDAAAYLGAFLSFSSYFYSLAFLASAISFSYVTWATVSSYWCLIPSTSACMFPISNVSFSWCCFVDCFESVVAESYWITMWCRDFKSWDCRSRRDSRPYFSCSWIILSSLNVVSYSVLIFSISRMWSSFALSMSMSVSLIRFCVLNSNMASAWSLSLITICTLCYISFLSTSHWNSC